MDTSALSSACQGKIKNIILSDQKAVGSSLSDFQVTFHVLSILLPLKGAVWEWTGIKMETFWQ